MIAHIRKWIDTQARELIAMFLAIVLFIYSPTFLRMLDPTMGAFDLGYLQRPILAAVQFFIGTFIAWTALWIYFKTLDKYVDTGLFKIDWQALSAFQRVVLTCAVFILLLTGYFISLALTPA